LPDALPTWPRRDRERAARAARAESAQRRQGARLAHLEKPGLRVAIACQPVERLAPAALPGALRRERRDGALRARTRVSRIDAGAGPPANAAGDEHRQRRSNSTKASETRAASFAS